MLIWEALADVVNVLNKVEPSAADRHFQLIGASSRKRPADIRQRWHQKEPVHLIYPNVAPTGVYAGADSPARREVAHEADSCGVRKIRPERVRFDLKVERWEGVRHINPYLRRAGRSGDHIAPDVSESQTLVGRSRR